MIFNNKILIVINREIICSQVIKNKASHRKKNYFEQVYINTFSKNKRITLSRGLMCIEFMTKNAQQTISTPPSFPPPPFCFKYQDLDTQDSWYLD